MLLWLCMGNTALAEEVPADALTPADTQEALTDTDLETDVEAETLLPTLTSAGLELGIHSISYPQLTGMTDEALQNDINQRILAAGDIENLLARLPLMMSGEVPMTIRWEGGLYGDWLSVAICASGPIAPDGRTTQVWASVNCNITDGRELTLQDLTDPLPSDSELLTTYLSDLLEWDIAPELSAHLENSAVTPLPDTWRMDATGLTLYYPIDQLSTLHSQAGVIQLCWYELAPVLNTFAVEGNPLYDMGALDYLTAGDHTRSALFAACEKGQLPGLPVTIGEALQPLTDRYGLLTDPDLCQGGRLFSLEGGLWRNVQLLTDSLHDKTWEDSTVNGIRADRISLYGLCTGLTTRNDWQEVLGEPDYTVTIDADTADAWRMVPGVSDYYQVGPHTLQLHADEVGVLVTVMLQ